MERRRQPRIQPAETITVVVLGEGHDAQSQRPMLGTVVDLSSRGMGLMIPAPLPLGTPIKIEANNELLLGEVCYCAPQDDAYRVGVAVKHRLAGLAQLRSLNRTLMGETPAVAPVDSPIIGR